MEPLIPSEPAEVYTSVKISVVVPLYDEEDSLQELADRLMPVLNEVAGTSFEILFVDDGSTDSSWECIRKIHTEHPQKSN